ncbi:MAG: PH domain-containing protein [Beutenbergiaceae bacterium]
MLATAFMVGAMVLLIVLADSPNDYTGDRVAIIGFSAAVVVLSLVLGRIRVDIDPEGLCVRNPLQTSRFTWAQVVQVRFGPHDPWVYLDLADGSTCPVMAIQAADGDRARRAAHMVARHVSAAEGREPD